MRHELRTEDRKAYLIEAVDENVMSLLKSGTDRPLYYRIARFQETVVGAPNARWTSDPYRALAFSRYDDADAFMQLVEEQNGHGFLGNTVGGLRFRQYAEVRCHFFEEPL